MLETGQQFGHYRILSALGAGGMGEVYLAEDTRLRRRVALKILPGEAANDELSRKRLIREAQAAATLDHTNICTVYDVGEADGQSFIAMQYIEGENLAARLKRGPIDLTSAVAMAVQVAAALDEAHRHGIVHRDIKPQNIMLTPGNQVKVLDFGLAKTTAVVDHDARTGTLISDAGVVSGTVPYMSPEQIRGEPLDARSDLFGVGCVLYEMIGRVNPFLRAHAADTMSAILSQEPAPLSANIPPDLQRIIRKCLEKDRERRYQTTRDLVIDLEGLRDALAQAASRPSDRQPALQPSKPRGVRRAALAAGAVLLLAAGIVAYLYLRSSAPATLSAADFVQITALPDSAAAPALSPDGRMVAFIRGEDFLGDGQIYVKLLPGGDPVQLTNDPRPKYGPTFTPDGSRIAYTAIEGSDNETMSWDTWTVPVLGGQPTRLLPNAAGLTWIDDHHVLFSEIEPGSGLHMGIVTASEDRQGERRIYFPAEERAMAHYSHISPDRRWVLVVEMDRTATFQQCRVVPFDGSSAGRPVGPNGICTSASWSPDGRWMFFSVGVNGATHLWRQRFPDGDPVQITSGAATEERGVTIAPDGRSLITAVGQVQGSLWIHEPGGERLVPLDGSVYAPRMLRDRTHVYCLVRRVGEPAALGFTRVDLASGKTDRILTEFHVFDFDISSDERFIAFTSPGDGQRREIWLAALDRGSPPRRIASDADHVLFGQNGELLYRSLTGTTNALFRIGMDGKSAVRLFAPVVEPGNVSPDGEWAIVVTAASGGGVETVAVPVHGGATKRLCTGSCGLVWSSDGSAVYVRALYATGKPRSVPHLLRPGQMLPDVSADGDAFQQVPASGEGQKRQDPSVFAFVKAEQRGNLFRLPLR